MVTAAWSELNLTDKVIFIHDVLKKIDNNTKEIIEKIFQIKSDVILVLNKIDLLPKEDLLKKISEIKNLYNFEETFLISAKNGSGCNKLIEYLAKEMPPNSFFYNENTISDKDFQEIIKNIWLTNAHVFTNKKFTMIPRDSVNNVIFKLFEEKGIKKEDFEKSIKYYSQKPELLDSILKKLRDGLEEV